MGPCAKLNLSPCMLLSCTTPAPPSRPPLQTAVHVALQIDCHDLFQPASYSVLLGEPLLPNLGKSRCNQRTTRARKCNSDILTCRPRKDYAGFPHEHSASFLHHCGQKCVLGRNLEVKFRGAGRGRSGGGRMAEKCLPSPRRKAPSL